MSRYLDEARARIMQGEEELARLRGVVKEAEKKRGEEEVSLSPLPLRSYRPDIHLTLRCWLICRKLFGLFEHN
jgi:hypothetical protein